MQHHVHPQTRNLPHMRSNSVGQHHMAMHAHMAPPPPPPLRQQQQQQQQQQHHTTAPTHHINSAPPVVSVQPPTQQGHHARMSHQQHVHTQLHTPVNSMQKLRQQHQHLNNNNSSSSIGHIGVGNVKQQYNSRNVTYNQSHTYQPTTQTAHMQQQQQQQLPMPSHRNSYQPPPNTHNPNAPKPMAQYYVNSNNNNNNNNSNNNKPKYTNDNNYKINNYAPAPKAILHNTARSAHKVTSKASEVVVVSQNVPKSFPPANTIAVPQIVPPAPPATALPQPTLQTHSNNIIITPDPEPIQTPVQPEVVQAQPEHRPVGETMDRETETETSETEAKTESSEEHKIGSKLSNEDSSISKSSKEKTPMCLVNELARFNKIAHQYRLTGERGPAHSKIFTVTLRLGDEEYCADGYKIKKAQHMAASKAIEQTKYKHPPPKIRRNEDGTNGRAHITPTVELNALAMKLGQRTYYLLDPTQIPPCETLVQPQEYGGPPPLPHLVPALPTPHPQHFLRRNGSYVAPPPPPPINMSMHVMQRFPQRGYPLKYGSRYPLPTQLGAPHIIHGPHGTYAPIPTSPSKITLFVGKQKFVGIGRTLQQAKHDAAARALQVLKSQATNPQDEALDESLEDGDKKSPISQVHEVGIKRNMTVHFKVLREEGPAHMKNFITACIVGSIVTEGEGNGKKISKKRAAEKMIAELAKLPPLTPTKETQLKRIKVKTPGKPVAPSPNGKLERRKRGNPVIKEKTTDPDDIDNPITKLIQLQQNRKQKEPVFELIAKNGNENSRRREFIFEVTAGNMVARGTGSNKKSAKRNAAQNLLESIQEVAEPENSSGKEQNEANATQPNATIPAANESTIMMDTPIVATPAGPVPGFLVIRQNKKHSAKKKDTSGVAKAATSTETTQCKRDVSIAPNESNGNEPSNFGETTASNCSNNSSASGDSGKSSGGKDSNTNSNGGTMHMKEQLLYLSKLLGFEADFSDYPKGNHNEFLTIVTLSSCPPQICHGVGSNSVESQNDAARNALKMLSELGLNNTKK